MIDIHNYIKQLVNKGLKIDVVYDVGAWHGNWSTAMQKTLPESRFFLFEGSSFYSESLSRLPFEHYIGLLSDEAGKEVDFYDSTQSGESYYKENSIWNERYPPHKAITNTINNLVAEHNLPHPDFIKLDTQGSELDILRGASDVLSGVKVIVCELPIVEYNIGAPTFSEYLSFFEDAGFYPMQLIEDHHLDNLLVQVDVVFLRKEIKDDLYGKSTQLLL